MAPAFLRAAGVASVSADYLDIVDENQSWSDRDRSEADWYLTPSKTHQRSSNPATPSCTFRNGGDFTTASFLANPFLGFAVMSMIEALIERLEAGERSLELDQAISVVFGFKGSAACPPYSHQSPLMRMATISRLRRIEIRQARRD